MATKKEITIGVVGVAVVAGAIGASVLLPSNGDAQIAERPAVVVVDVADKGALPDVADAGVEAFKIVDEGRVVVRRTATTEASYTMGGVTAALAECDRQIAFWTSERARFLQVLKAFEPAKP